MMETATGVAFLVSSLYGAGQPATVAQTAAVPQAGQATTTEASPLTKNNTVEAYVRTALADEPLLINIAGCESAFRQFGPDGQPIRGRVNRADVGVLQINEKYHADEAKKLGYDIYTTEGNVAFGKYLYTKYGADPWISSSKCWIDQGGLARN